jgi:hypothetical protein
MIDLKIKTKKWVMLTNGTDRFERFQVRPGNRMSIGTPGLFPIFADTEEELLAKVFKDPSVGATTYRNGQVSDSAFSIDASTSIEEFQQDGEIDQAEEEVTLCEPNDNLDQFKSQSCFEECCEVFGYIA